MKPYIINIGDKFNYLEVEEITKNHERKIYICKCKCGKITKSRGVDLVKGRVKSCGCLIYEMGIKGTHKKSGSSTYKTWSAMIQRCTNPNHSYYKYYGGAGITVCQRWLNSFELFLEDMGERPENMTLDRFPNQKGNYEPGNCRWASRKEQARNTKSNRNYFYKNEWKSLSEWCEIFNLTIQTIDCRLKRGWAIEKALEVPIDKKCIPKKYIKE